MAKLIDFKTRRLDTKKKNVIIEKILNVEEFSDEIEILKHIGNTLSLKMSNKNIIYCK